MRILITGGAGFVGTNLALSLCKNNKVFCIDNFHRRNSALNVPLLKTNGVEFINCDITKEIKLNIKKIGFIIHCASEPSVLSGVSDPINMININIMGTAQCLELAIEYKAKFIFISTNRVYPYGFNNRSLYGSTKLSAEYIIREYSEMYGIEWIINRCGILSGPHQDGNIDQGLIAYWIKQHLTKGKLNYIGYGGKGGQTRSALHIDDLSDLIKIQIKKFKEIKNNIFDVSGGDRNQFTLRELTKMVRESTGKKIRIGCVPETRIGDVHTCLISNKIIENSTGWKPKRSLQTIIKDTTEWMRKEIYGS